MLRALQIANPLRTASADAVRNLLLERVRSLDGVTLDVDQAYTVRLCTSEFVDNALKYTDADPHAELTIDVDLDPRRSRLRITITDPRLTVPDMGNRDENLTAPGGRGVTVAIGYADDAGWHQRRDAGGNPTGWSVWFEVGVELDSRVFGEVTATTAEVPLEPVPAPIPALRVVSLLGRGGTTRFHRPGRRPRGRTAA
ncbi:ATP-binding protein [Kitasatospora sp. NPDC054768]